MVLSVKTGTGTYPVVISCGGLSQAGEHFNLCRKCLILTDENIPKSYIETLKEQIKEPFVYTTSSGEESKTLDGFCISVLCGCHVLLQEKQQ